MTIPVPALEKLITLIGRPVTAVPRPKLQVVKSQYHSWQQCRQLGLAAMYA
jgi:hypothetical protein